MYCANCGTQREDEINYCRHCGQTFEQETAVAEKTGTAPTEIVRIMQSLTSADLSHDRVSAIVRQVLGLLAILLAAFAVTQKPSPAIFLLYAVPSVLGGVVIVLERRASVGKAVFVLLMLIPYLTLFLAGVPPILVSGVQDIAKTTAALAPYFGTVSLSVGFLVVGFLFIILSSITSMIFTKRSIIAGGAALGLAAVFAIVFMGLLGSPNTAVAASLTVANQLDSNIKIHTTALAPDSSGKLTETQQFKSNELIFTYTTGLTAGARFGFRVTSSSGQVVIPFDRSSAATAKGVGYDKFDAFNTAEERLDPGSYTLELVVAEGWKTSVVARTTVAVLTEMNPNYGVQTVDPYAWLAAANGDEATAFAAADSVNIVLYGPRLQDDVTVMIKDGGDKVVYNKSFSAMPFGKSQYVIADKASSLGSGQFVAELSTQNKEAIYIYFTIK